MKIKIDAADKYFSIWVRLRDKQCKRCGSQVQYNDKGLPVTHQASHFKGRGKESTRFMPENVDTLCYGCHQFFTSHPPDHYEWQVKTKGQDIVDLITLTANTTVKKERELQKLYWKQRIKEDFGIIV